MDNDLATVLELEQVRTRLDLIELEGRQPVLAGFSGPRPAAALLAGTEHDGHLGARWGLQDASDAAEARQPRDYLVRRLGDVLAVLPVPGRDLPPDPDQLELTIAGGADPTALPEPRQEGPKRLISSGLQPPAKAHQSAGDRLAASVEDAAPVNHPSHDKLRF